MNPFSLANPWVLLGVGGAIAASFFFGIYMEHGRFMGFVAKVDAVGTAAAKESATRKAADEKLRKEKEVLHERNRKNLAADVSALRERLRNASARGSVVPSPAKGAGVGAGGADGRLCFSREQLRQRLDGAVAKYAEQLDGISRRLVELAERGAGALNNLNTCAAWAKDIQPRP